MNFFTRYFLLTALLGATMPFSCHAALIERDWLAPGDGLLTLDTSTGLEWLDLPVSALSQFGTSDINLATTLAIAQTDPGGLFEGFSLASSEETLRLAQSTGVITGQTSTAESRANGIAAEQLSKLLGTLRVGNNSEGFAGVVTDPVLNPVHRCHHLRKPRYLTMVFHQLARQMDKDHSSYSRMMIYIRLRFPG